MRVKARRRVKHRGHALAYSGRAAASHVGMAGTVEAEEGYSREVPMKIDAVDMFYLAMPEIDDVADGSQDMLLVRVTAGDLVGWGEGEAAPLPSIAALVCPMSHSACHPVGDSVIGARLDSPEDVKAIVRSVRAKSLDLLQAPHTLSGIEIAMWDLLGRAREVPVYELLGVSRVQRKTPYASVLFGDSPEETLAKASSMRRDGYSAAKFGWGGFGHVSVEDDAAQLTAAREGLGADATLLIDAGTVWVDDVEQAAARLDALAAAGVLWLEEPFVSGAIDAYHELSLRCHGGLRLAGGEGSHDPYMAEQMIVHGGIGFVQIDAGRIGGISEAMRVAEFARAHGVQFVNHTFTSNLALSASLQPMAGSARDWLCEYPTETKELARKVTRTPILRDSDGLVAPPAGPGLGVSVDVGALGKYLVELEVELGGRTLYRTPALAG
jgi:L-alanine-DL-glutamate epimerase-like enolase superfamily enzyme